MNDSSKMNLIENNRNEFKTILNDKFEKEVVGFLNAHEGGNIYIGIDDGGNIVGVEDVDRVQLSIADRIKNNIQPSALGLFDVIIEVKEQKNVIRVIISSGVEKPYYIRSQGMSPSGCYIRIGSSTQPMSISMIDQTYAKRTRNWLSSIASPRKQLSFEQLKIYYEEHNMRLNEQFKRNLELLTNEEQDNYIAYLLSDENGVSIKVAKYSGKDKINLVENEEYGYCSLIKATKSVLNKFEVENITRTKITSKERIEKKLVNPIALKEAIINAVVHNDYSREVPPLFEIFIDRIVITSYGGLVNGLSKDDFFSCCSMPRNRELMRVFKDIKLVEQLGSGMERILAFYDKSIFSFTDNFLKVTFPFAEGFESGTINDMINGTINGTINNAKQITQQIIELIISKPEVTLDEIANDIGIGRRTVAREIKMLKDQNLLIRVGSNKKGTWKIQSDKIKDDTNLESGVNN